MAPTDRFIINLKATGKAHKHFDGGGLHIHVSPVGGKLWRMGYRFNNKPKLLSFGAYPAVTLKMARDRRDEAKSLIARGIDPAEHKKDLKRLSVALAENTFEAVGREWYAKTKDIWEEKRAKAVLSHLEKNVFPFIGKMPIAAVKAPDLLAVAKRIEERGANYYAHAVMQTCGRVFRYAIATGRAEHDITADLRDALTPHKGKHFANGEHVSVNKDISDAGVEAALRIAMVKFNGQPLTVNGTNEFKQRCIEIAARAKLSLVFSDAEMEKTRLEYLHAPLIQHIEIKSNTTPTGHPKGLEVVTLEKVPKRAMGR